jgi:hypothetical protein
VGLVERRKIKEIEDTIIPGRMADFVEICGKEIPCQIDWESFDGDMEGLNFLDNISFHRINMALRTICCDEMGRETVREGVSQIKLKNVPQKDQMSISFDKGVLEMHCAYAQRTDGMYSDNTIRETLLAGL